ncbi:MAG: aminotransferase class III-fold pyridoxal phosphate-dependent enzyme, partial [Leucobacter sp.]|nr:aminotransferase class III-fold pyridoxal phosphate-dependent enzyme [Leucobacter sp.]
MTEQPQAGLVRPEVDAATAAEIARECYGIEATATELGSNQDRNFLLTEADGNQSVLRIDNPAWSDEARDAQHAALEAYRAAGVAVPAGLPGLDGALTQHSRGFAVRRSEFVVGTPMLEAGYFAPTVMREFGALAAASVAALAPLQHEGLRRTHMWQMRVAHAETERLTPAIGDANLRERVQRAAAEAQAALAPLSDALPIQAIHGDLTDDNVMGVRGEDQRLHPHTVLDLGDLSYGWRVAELAVMVTSLLHHEPERPLTVLEAVASFHQAARLSAAEARAVWPLVVLRSSLLVASGHRQLDIDGTNDYARDRISGEQSMFDAATRYPLGEMTEQVLARLGFQGIAVGDGLKLVAAPAPAECLAYAPLPPHTDGSEFSDDVELRTLLPTLSRSVAIVDPGIESASLDAGKWLSPNAEHRLIDRALLRHAAAVLPYGVYRLTRTEIDAAEAAATWPIDTEVWVRGGEQMRVTSPVAATVHAVSDDQLVLQLDGHWRLVIAGFTPTLESGAELAVGTVLATGTELGLLPESSAKRQLVVGLRRSDAPELLPLPGGAQLVEPERVPAWRRLSRDPAAMLLIESRTQLDESGDEALRREKIFASAQERYYETPMQVERGWRHHLVDTTGRAYVDMVNNVTGLGHGHPGVADAVNRQIRVLNTNSRFLYRELADYSERLLALLPAGSGLDTVLLVNSGSEAVDLALRLAQAATGRSTVVALREAYHGWTLASDAVTTSAFDNPHALANRPDWVHIADVPNRFRGTYRGPADDARVGA